MARFGKKAELDEQKSTKEVECIVSVSDDNVSINANTGKPMSYYVEAQRLQDNVDPDDAAAGKADSNPYITNKKEYSICFKSEEPFQRHSTTRSSTICVRRWDWSNKSDEES